ncbi:thrombomodulin [Hippocampus zosterae]|uniref:thrombomodulin n=1 Tax=Hippocampus zosterae TaxID=109293 RepID=UPI00223CED36|nr:thrombomodulin [Hippocampus zosterae]
MNARSCSNMKDAAGLFVAALAVLVGILGGTEPDGGLCVDGSCFAVFRHPGDFASAQRHCEERNGHLMAAGSSGSRDVLAQLLRNSSGRFWIGLHRSTGCPNATSPLKGYEWTAEDAQGDSADWAPSFDGSCSSPRCVAVSEADRLRWVQEPCDAPVTGFLCEYHFAYSCESIAIDGEAPTYDTPLGFGGGGLHSLPPGSIAALTPSKRKFVCSESWVEAPWSCEILEGGCEHQCATNDEHEPSCSCPPGLSVNPANGITCEVDALDPCARLRCEFACLEGDDGAHACACDRGFTLAPDGRSCVDFDDCSDERQCPGDNSRCVNTVGGFRCECQGGFKLTDGSCVDRDECASAPCEHMCDNTPGSYKCSCSGGYRVDPLDANKCELHCGKKECVAECDPNDRRQCYCPDGYISDERKDHTWCVDLDECGDSYCEHGCRNTYGGYVCSCRKGFTLVNEVFCVRNEDEDEEREGSGEAATIPNAPAVTPHEVAPTRQPSAVTVGGLVAIIVCCVLVVVVVVFLSQHILNKKGKVERGAASKAADGGETHSLHGMGSEA